MPELEFAKYQKMIAKADAAGVPRDSIDAEVRRRGFDVPSLIPRSRMGPGGPMLLPTQQQSDRDVQNLPSTLSALGGLAGSILGPAGTIGGAGLAATGGYGLRQLLNGQPWNSGDAQAEAAKGASLAGLGEALALPVGLAVNPVLKSRIAQRVMANVLNPGDKLLGRSPNLVRNALADQVPLESGMTMGGTGRVGGLLDEARTLGNDMANAHHSPVAVDPREVIQQARDLINAKLPKNQTTRIEDSPEWQALEQEFLSRFRAPQESAPVPQFPAPRPVVSKMDMRRPIAGRPMQRGFPMGEKAAAETRLLDQQVRGAAQRVQNAQSVSQAPREFNPFDLEDMLNARRGADENIIRLHNAREGRSLGRNVAISPDMDERFNDAVATVLRDKIRSISPEVGQQMERISDLMARKAAYHHAESKADNLVTANPLLAALRIASGKGPASRMAINLYRQSLAQPGISQFLPAITRFGPLAAGTAIGR